MAISHKQAAKQIIDKLPEDATLDDILGALSPRVYRNGERQASIEEAVFADEDNSQPAERRPVTKGYITVLEPMRPLPTISVDLVNYIIEKMRREREDRFLGLTEDEA